MHASVQINVIFIFTLDLKNDSWPSSKESSAQSNELQQVFLNTYYVPGSVLGVENKPQTLPALGGRVGNRERVTISQLSMLGLWFTLDKEFPGKETPSTNAGGTFSEAWNT